MNFRFLENDLFVTKIVLACYVKPGAGAVVHSNRPSHGLALNLGGKKQYKFSTGETIRVQHDDIIYLPKGSNYSVENIENGGCYAINFLLSGEPDTPPFAIHIKNKDIFLQPFIKSVSAFQKQEYGYSEKCLRELYDILYKLKQLTYKTSYNSPKQRAIINTATAFIADNYTSKTITIHEICNICSISDTYLRRLFKNEFGISPIEYINRLRLTYAKSLIASKEYTVSEVCFMCGFNDTSYFSRAFKNFYGFPPRDLKK